MEFSEENARRLHHPHNDALVISLRVGDYNMHRVLIDNGSSTVGYELLSFMDAFSGYNQIRMDETDQEKTSSVTSWGLFYYKVMPFKLKNAGATYQKLVDKMFVHQIGRDV